ncbi:MAG: CD1247 N-terminal domain-containing protein [Thermovirgaceae bacterium]
MKARERIAYLDGLIEGLSPEGEDQRRIYEGIIQALKALADEIDEQAEIIDEQQDFIEEISDYCEQLEADMSELEETPWEYEGDEDEADFSSVTCPECGHVFFFDPEAYEEGESLECPACGFCMTWPKDVAEQP